MDDAAAKSERRISALALSHGIGIGPLVFFQDESGSLSRTEISEEMVDNEVSRLHSAAAVCGSQLNELIDVNSSNPPEHIIDIFDLQLLILEQSSLIGNIEAHIREKHVSADWALKSVQRDSVGRQSNVEDPHISEKHLDIADVCNRLESILKGSAPTHENKYAGAIVAAREIRPSSIIELKKCGLAGIITELGGWTSHSSILAREFMIPMVSGVRAIDGVFAEGSRVVVDGERGMVIVGPEKTTVHEYSALLIDNGAVKTDSAHNVVSETLDGHKITIRANVDIPETYGLAKSFGAEGIGLFRSESLISRPGQIPSEDEQVSAYRQIAEVAGNQGVRIRTFDISIDQMAGNRTRTETNPSLGLRSIRLSLNEQQHFRSQIRAILRASFNNRIDILLPMVSGVMEVVAAKTILEEECQRLKDGGILIGEPKIGAMIEVPSGVMTAREIARKVDFMALGTNDLVQYLLAIDRDNESVADWYQTLHPAVIRAISEVFSAAKERDIPVLVCGEMAGSPFYVPVLIGLGARELSMNINSINQIRHLISGITLEKTSQLLSQISSSETSEETEKILRAFYALHWVELFPAGILDAKHR